MQVRHSKYPLLLLTHTLNTAWRGINVQQVMTSSFSSHKTLLHPSPEHSGLPTGLSLSSFLMSTQTLDTAWTGYLYSVPPQTKPLLHLTPEHFGLPMGLSLSSFLMSTQAMDTAWRGYHCPARENISFLLRQNPFYIPTLNTLAYRWDSAFPAS